MGDRKRTCPVAHGGRTAKGVCPVTGISSSSPEEESDSQWGGICPISSSGGLDMTLVVNGTDKPVPLGNIPATLKISDLRDILQVSSVKLKPGKTWDDVEFFADDGYWFPIPLQVTLEAAEIKSGQTIYITYKHSGTLPPVKLILPNNKKPLCFKNLPSYANIYGLRSAIRSILDEPDIDLSYFEIRRAQDVKSLPDNFQLKLLQNESLVLVSPKGNSSTTDGVSNIANMD